MTLNETIPKTHLAAVYSPDTGRTTIESVPTPQQGDLAPGQALVRVLFSGVCGSDINLNAAAKAANKKLVVGHEGTGLLVALNDPLCRLAPGARVGVKYIADTCNQCDFCLKGNDMLCPDMKAHGRHVPGTFQQYVIAYTSQLAPLPDAIDLVDAAPILCGGVTVYKALRDGGVEPGDWVSIPGAGGGCGLLAIQYAKHFGLNTIAVDTGADKEALARAQGADKWVDFESAGGDLIKAVKAATPDGFGPHASIICSPSGDGYPPAFASLRPGGTAVLVGLPEGYALPVDVCLSIREKKHVKACFVGNRQEAIDALRIAATGAVKCPVAVRPFADLQATYDEMLAGTLRGRVVIDLRA
ncbi:alcohol dehydrogenase [Vanrija albida]|uniref:alcohol dehydrogenase n=1 Tax=Vanrija albida TaxID=181172 RepID=A0ABR3QBC4_9TREE